MKYFGALVITAFTIVVVGAGTTLAAGYERKSSYQTHSKIKIHSRADGWSSFNKATYLDKIPSAVDEIALSFRDFLGQFGLKLKKPR